MTAAAEREIARYTEQGYQRVANAGKAFNKKRKPGSGPVETAEAFVKLVKGNAAVFVRKSDGVVGHGHRMGSMPPYQLPD